MNNFDVPLGHPEYKQWQFLRMINLRIAEKDKKDLERLNQTFGDNPQVKVTKTHVFELTLQPSSKAEAIIGPKIAQKFPDVERKLIRFYFAIDPGFDTVFYAEMGEKRCAISIPEWGYCSMCFFRNIDQAIEECQRVVSLVC